MVGVVGSVEEAAVGSVGVVRVVGGVGSVRGGSAADEVAVIEAADEVGSVEVAVIEVVEVADVVASRGRPRNVGVLCRKVCFVCLWSVFQCLRSCCRADEVNTGSHVQFQLLRFCLRVTLH